MVVYALVQVADVKKRIAEERGDDYAVELQKLIYNGKVLTMLSSSSLARQPFEICCRFSMMPRQSKKLTLIPISSWL